MSSDRKAYGRAYYAANRETYRARSRAYYIANRDAARAKAQVYNKSERGKQASRRTKLARYGITPEQWDTLFSEQGQRCGCCGSGEPHSKLGWATDHDHDTKKVRGILCYHCNIGLGRAGDTYAKAVERCTQFLAYLRKAEPS